MSASAVKTRKKLIEVALPLEAINAASAREKSIRHGHPSTLHLWWARRPLAAARAVIFAQMVDDPSAWPERFPTEEEQDVERARLFRIIEQLVLWENTTNEDVLEAARAEIRRSWRDTCEDNKDHPHAAELFDPDKLPGFHDPFCGGGALPLEAQRLGLEARASDLNPVAVLITKAMIEIPPKFAGRPPVGPLPPGEDEQIPVGGWTGAKGLAEDVRRYGAWMRTEAEKRIGHLYPKAVVTDQMAREQPDLRPDVGRGLTVIAWLWARTVKTPDPALGGVHVPLLASFWLCKKSSRLAWLEPVVDGENRTWTFDVRTGDPDSPEEIGAGTKVGRGDFRCLLSGTPISAAYVREQGREGAIGYRLVAVIADAGRRRIYLPAAAGNATTAEVPIPRGVPTSELPTQALGFRVQNYGYRAHAHLFTPRQLTALGTFVSLVAEARARAYDDARTLGSDDGPSLDDGGTGARAYADAVAVMLGIAVSRRHDRWTAFSIWHTVRETLESLIRLSAVPMTWEFAEGNPFSQSTGNFLGGVELTAKAIEPLGFGAPGKAEQRDARATRAEAPAVVCTDPPYFDNIPYADLSDLFYVWLRPSVAAVLPTLMSTLLVPKTAELIADPARHGDRDEAERFFFDGMSHAIGQLRESAMPGIPLAIFYAFRQSEAEAAGGTVSTGWDRFLSALVDEGLSVVGTWPIRTEQTGGLRNVGRNSLATSVVLVCRPRAAEAGIATRREFDAALKSELPKALRHLQHGNIAPVDLAQSAIGPGMGIYTRYAKVLDANGWELPVRGALALINQTLDEVLAEQEGDFDADTRWAVAWFDQHGFAEGEFGVAETLSKAKNTSVSGMVEAGIVESGRGKVRLLRPDELPRGWDPVLDSRLTVWEATHQLVRTLDAGERAAADLARRLGGVADSARDLAYRLYLICERKKRAPEALAYNSLVQSWTEIQRWMAESADASVQERMEI
jgi:putative DNA methylase